MNNTKENILVYLDTDVYTEAKARIKHALSILDDFYVGFSGGKDSLTVLHLIKEVYDELGIKKKIKVCFYDEELIPMEVINFVKSYKDKDWIDMKYYVVPLESHYYILGKTYSYIQWDPNREHVRPIPDWAIVDFSKVYSQYNLMERVVKDFGMKGNIGVFLGLRAAESITRYMGFTRIKGRYNYIHDTEIRSIKKYNVIYDWSEKDVFKYFYDKKIQYCKVYDWQNLNQDNFRVATPIHAEHAKRFHKLKTRDPMLYESIIRVFPDMKLQELYYTQMSHEKKKSHYPRTWEGLKEYIKNEIQDPEQKKLALKRYYEVLNAKRMKLIKGVTGHDGYDIDYVFNKFLSGGYKRRIMPVPKNVK